MDLDDKLPEGNRAPAGGLKARNVESKRPFKSRRPFHKPIKPQATTETIVSNDTQ
jgi:hypothetical protein